MDKLEDNIGKEIIIQKLIKIYDLSEADANDYYKEALTNYNE